jgi:hypothetical protein
MLHAALLFLAFGVGFAVGGTVVFLRICIKVGRAFAGSR